MKLRTSLVFLLVLAGLGCNSTNVAPVSTGSSKRSYNGSASVGDFLAITLDPVALTLTYTDLSNGDTGVVPYTVNANGTYTLNDPNHNLLVAYEVPNYALLLQAAKAGPNHDTLALVTAVQKSTISLATWEGHDYNYMQFRTTSGGVDVGSVSLDAQANVSITSYSPYQATQGNPFHVGGFPGSGFQLDPSGSFLDLSEGNGSTEYVFGTANGIFAVDNPNGTIMGLEKAATKYFDPSFAGTYQAIYYQKTGAQTGQGNIETGTPTLQRDHGDQRQRSDYGHECERDDAGPGDSDAGGGRYLSLRRQRTSGPLLRSFHFSRDHGHVAAGCVRNFHGSRHPVLFVQSGIAVELQQYLRLSVWGRA